MDYYRNNKVFKFLLLFANGRQEFDSQRVKHVVSCSLANKYILGQSSYHIFIFIVTTCQICLGSKNSEEKI